VWSQTDALLAVSEELRAEALAVGVRAERIHVLPNGVDAALFTPSPEAAARVRAELGLGTGPVVGFVGSLKPWHGTEVLLRAFAQLHARRADASLLVVGDGPQREALTAAVAAAGLQRVVHFTGAVDHTQVPEYMAAMDVATAPYLPQDDFYFSPIKVYEAMMLGLPVVVSRIGQIAGLADAGLVAAATPGNVEDWVRALEAMLDDAAGRASLAARGRDWARRERTWTANARRAAALAETILAA
jgi:glycosyltransferase involved in cell wall biosynthesis